MPPKTVFLTGATGMIGSHVLARALADGWAVRALVRGLPPAFLERPGVTVIRGDLTQAAAVTAGLMDTTAVIHCAAKVGDTGNLDDYRRVNVESLRHLAAAAGAAKELTRFVSISSLGVYAARDHFGTTEETAPDAHGIDAYTRTKVQAEHVIQAAMVAGLPAVILRPGFVYGPRDRHVLPPLAAALRARRFAYFGSGEQLLDNTGVHNVVEAIFLALSTPAAVGQVFNITDAPLVSRRRFVGAVTEGLGLPAPQLTLPLTLMRPLTAASDCIARILRVQKPLLLSRARYKFLALHLAYSIAKAQRLLGYRAAVSFDDGMREALAWFLAAEALRKGSPQSGRLSGVNSENGAVLDDGGLER